ncbi:T9SS C-terminal target domain-containing protein [candidate division KSB1 bacterium]|nr:right-handed parallel beta-helix repeat-containing protein [candidate division KSB1 bacterium]RQW00994.1 MAG: T9SS C-terminal target domain-containing protein [candidate division KSB1 bacterium]
MKSRHFFLVILFFIFSLGESNAKTLDIGSGRSYANLRDAAPHAMRGDTLLFYPGIYAGGQSVTGLQGTASDWIVIQALSPVIIRGGANAWHLTDPAYVRIIGFVFEGQTGNGVNIDDGGDYTTPAHHVEFKDCTFRDMDASGNNDLLKLSGVDHFFIENCSFAFGAAGGSGIDMVGCHFGDILGNRFDTMGSNAIQTKGGSMDILIQANWFENCGQRSINIGGSTGLAYFRPLDATYEAARIKVYANIFIGSIAPVAYVGCVQSNVINNTIIYPEKWVVRILQETVDPARFLPCQDNSFQNNLVYLGDISVETNIGPNTAPETFFFDANFWYNYDNPNWRGPEIPVIDTNQVINKDPLFLNIDGLDFSLHASSPAIGLVHYDGEPLQDYRDMLYNSPRSVGAYEGDPLSRVNMNRDKSLQLKCLVQPNPCNSIAIFRYEVSVRAHTSLCIYDMLGRQIVNLVDAVQEPGEYRYAYDFADKPSGVYLYRLVSGDEQIEGRMTLLR